jgi:hypothetical protein
MGKAYSTQDPEPVLIAGSGSDKDENNNCGGQSN